ncbi:MAG TPA: tRNA (adenosine(37)-N6)-threonylcarbamoyltransferase complex ATPase subunit type 1 TsaE [Rhizomicrobium sp.]|jgi:tRNA threonylcarbamoyl adenosine modification protein YjeE
MADIASRFAGGLVVKSLAETEDLAGRIARSLGAGDAIALEGDLGAGKTTLARGILRALGVSEAVPSPTFTLVQEYQAGGLRVLHCDLFRVENAAELDELGLDEALTDGAVLIEWPERARERLRQDALSIRIEILSESERRMELSGPARWAHLVAGVGN